VRHATVVIVEPDRRTALTLQRQLTELQHEVGAVLRGVEAAAPRVEELRSDLVLIDLALVQGREGIDLAQRLHTASGADLIFMTRRRRTQALDPEHARLAGGYLVVPSSTEELNAVVEIALARRERAAAGDSDTQRLQRLTDSVPVLLAYLGSDGRYQFANRLHEKWFGIARERLAGRSLLEVVGAEWRETIAQPLAQALAGQAVSLDYEPDDAEGRHVQVSLVPDRSAQGVHGVFFAGANVTARAQAQRALLLERNRLRAVLEAMDEAVIAVDTAQRIQYMNPAAEALTQWGAAEVGGLPVDEVVRFVEIDGGRRVDSPSREALLTGGSAHLPPGSSLLSRDGQEYAVEDVCTPMRDTRGAIVGAVLVVRSLAAHRALTTPGAHDALTGLMTRREFERAVERKVRNARETHQQHALLYIDVDRLQTINETCGHHAGDELLRQVTSTMLAKLRRSDVLARAGGDEFAVLMPNCPLHRARQIGQTLLDTVREAGFNWQGRTCSLTLSVGAVSTGQFGLDAQGLLAAAEAASTLAKDAGGNRVHVYQGNGTGTLARSAETDWATRIATGLARDRFHLFAQRVVPVDAPPGDTPCAYEILLRLEGHNQALLPPMAFLPAAERCRLMLDVDRWVITHTFNALAPYLRDPPPDGGPRYSLNLSGASLADEGLLDFIAAELQRSGVPPQCVCFEIAEATVLSHLHQASVLAKGLKRAGCGFALDHFHSGVGAYAYLQDLPVDYVKIDGSFVKGMLSDQLDCAVVEGIARIGQALGIQTVGECAESAAILARLKDLGVAHAQGYLIHRPEPLLSAMQAHSPAAGQPPPRRAGADWTVEWYQG